MAESGFIHLRNHSAYSLSQGAIKIPDLIQRAKEDGMPAVGLTDTANLFGSLEFSQLACKAGIQPLVGCQLSVKYLSSSGNETIAPLAVLARTSEGLGNLRKLSSAGYIETDPAHPWIHLEYFLENVAGLFLLTGGEGSYLNQLCEYGHEEEARMLLEKYCCALGENLGVELQRWNVPSERMTEPMLVALADSFGLPLVASNNCFFSVPEMATAQDALLCIGQGRTLGEKDRETVSSEAWFKPSGEMRRLFGNLPEACDNTLYVAQRCAVMVEQRKPLLPVSPKVASGKTEEETLREMARKGLVARLKVLFPDGKESGEKREYEARLEEELDIIERMGFAGYFLIVADFIQWAKDHGIPVGPGRGSGAGSLVAYALTITDIDPLRFGLLFERFLNPERISMPDFDIDFCQHRRDEVIDYVRSEYGARRVAQIITFGKLQARAAIRDVGRVMALPYGLVNRVAELIPIRPGKEVTLEQAIREEPRLQEMLANDETVSSLMNIARRLEGLYRHVSTHAAGIVIGDRDLLELVPLYRDPKSEMLVTQFNMKYVEQAGLVKFDFLGLATLTILQRGVQFLADLGISVDIAHIPLDDPQTYAMLARGDTAGIFQFEGAGMRETLKQMQVNRFEDLIAGVALYRPGPMENIPEYCRRKHGKHWEAPHESVRSILEETFGIMVYQEQVMQIAREMAGYSLGSADILRRAMGKKIASEMEKQRAVFVRGATEKGIDGHKADEVFDLMAKFADYGFNKSHAAAYALVSYRTAWLKAHHPVAFLAACMSIAREKTDKLAALCQEASRLGVPVLPVDINASRPDFSVEKLPEGGYGIRYALGAVKRVGLAAMEQLAAARGDTPFRDLTDFVDRCGGGYLNKLQMESLARAGAFDRFEKNRRRVFQNVELILKRAVEKTRQKESGQAALFGGEAADEAFEALKLPPATPWAPFERLSEQAAAIGFHLNQHPIESYEGLLRRLGITPFAELETFPEEGKTRSLVLAGCVVARKERPTRTGKKMAWVTLSDPGATCEVTLFSETLETSRDLLVSGAPVLLRAEAKREGDTLRLTASSVQSLEKVAAAEGAHLIINYEGNAALSFIQEILSGESGGKGRVTLRPVMPGGEIVSIAPPGRYQVTPRLIERLGVMDGISVTMG